MLNFLKKIWIGLIPAVWLLIFWKWYLWTEIKVFWFMSYYYFIFALLISPISFCLRKVKISKTVGIKIISYRRALGVITGLFVFLHVTHFEERVYSLWKKYYLEDMSYIDFILESVSRWYGKDILWMNFYAFIFWIISFIIITTLLITSNNFSQKKLWGKLWNKLQKLVYPLFIILVLHIYFIGWWKGIYMYPAIFLIMIRIYVFFNKK